MGSNRRTEAVDAFLLEASSLNLAQKALNGQRDTLPTGSNFLAAEKLAEIDAKA